ncbi:MAG: ketopantoate reductase family protein [Eubacteriales bacterium]|nr:ketopantoate reductase family protein [Eubacteriales bacterium]
MSEGKNEKIMGQRKPDERTPDAGGASAPIVRTAICGMGALGMMYGGRIEDNLGPESVTYLMDPERAKRHRKDTYTINGEKRSFRISEYGECGVFDLVILAVKYGSMREAVREMEPAVRADTVLVSVMNGIESEACLAERYDRTHIITSVALGMDAMRKGTALTYTKFGKLQIGALESSQRESLKRLTDFFERAGVTYEVSEDVLHTMWNKFMLNVGLNQAITAYEADYSIVLSPGPVHEEMLRAMREVSSIAEKRGIRLTEEDIRRDLQIAGTLDPKAYPSMRQDVLAGRKTEVDMFAGKVIELGREYGIPTPVNEKYFRKIREIEKAF